MIIIPSDTRHHTQHEKTSKLIVTVIYLNPTIIINYGQGKSNSVIALFETVKRYNKFKYKIGNKEWNNIEIYLSNLFDEYKGENFDQEQGITLWLYIIMLQLVRHCTHNYSSNNLSYHGPTWMNDILNYIDENLSGDLSLNTLAKISFVSPSHISRVFKSNFNMNITDFITTKRIILAKELLINHDYPISYIAEKCGYNSLPHFYRTFKDETLFTPSGYREKWKKR